MNTDPPNSPIAMSADRPSAPSDTWDVEPADAVAGCRVRRTVRVGLDPADAIHETQRRLQSKLVCMASHGRGRSAVLLGSVTLDVIARGHDPIIVVVPAFDGRVGGHRLVAYVEESPASQAFVAAALGWARLLGLHLTVVTVAELVPESLRKVPVRRRFGPDGDVPHARTGFSRFVLGSVTAEILVSSPDAVLVLPGPLRSRVTPEGRDGDSPGHAGG